MVRAANQSYKLNGNRWHGAANIQIYYCAPEAAPITAMAGPLHEVASPYNKNVCYRSGVITYKTSQSGICKGVACINVWATMRARYDAWRKMKKNVLMNRTLKKVQAKRDVKNDITVKTTPVMKSKKNKVGMKRAKFVDPIVIDMQQIEHDIENNTGPFFPGMVAKHISSPVAVTIKEDRWWKGNTQLFTVQMPNGDEHETTYSKLCDSSCLTWFKRGDCVRYQPEPETVKIIEVNDDPPGREPSCTVTRPNGETLQIAQHKLRASAGLPNGIPSTNTSIFRGKYVIIKIGRYAGRVGAIEQRVPCSTGYAYCVLVCHPPSHEHGSKVIDSNSPRIVLNFDTDFTFCSDETEARGKLMKISREFLLDWCPTLKRDVAEDVLNTLTFMSYAQFVTFSHNAINDMASGINFPKERQRILCPDSLNCLHASACRFAQFSRKKYGDKEPNWEQFELPVLRGGYSPVKAWGAHNVSR